MSRPRLAAIGLGAVGFVLAKRWIEAKLLDIGPIVTTSINSASAAVQALGQGEAMVGVPPNIEYCDIIMIAVPENALPEWVARLGQICAPENRSCIVFHTSGAFDSQVLQPLANRRFHVASAHPLAAFHRNRELNVTAKAPLCCIEGDAQAVSSLKKLFANIGFSPLELAPINRALYHAAIIFSTNFIPVLIDTSLRLYHKIGIDGQKARQILIPIIEDVVKIALDDGPVSALAGPLVRGQCGIVREHLESIEREFPNELQLYKLLSKAALQLAIQKKTFPKKC